MTFDEYIELAQYRIDDLDAGQYLVGDIYGEYWDSIPNHTGFGPQFKEAVLGGKLKGIRWVERRSDNNQPYEVTG